MSDTALLDPPAETTESPMTDGLDDSFTEVVTDWDTLQGDPMPDGDILPNETIEEWEDRKEKEAAEEAEAAANPAPAEDKKPDAEPNKVDAPADADMKAKAEMWDKFDEAFLKTPEVIARVALKGMSDAQKQAFLQEALGQTPAATPAPEELPDIPEDFVPVGEMEEFLMARIPDIKSIGELRKEIADLKANGGQAIQEQVRALHDPISTSVYYGELAMAKFEAIAEAIGLDLPDPDLAAVREKLKDGRTTIKSAVRSLIGETYKTKVAEHKQSKAPRPQTPANHSTRQPARKSGASLYEIAKEMGEL